MLCDFSWEERNKHLFTNGGLKKWFSPSLAKLTNFGEVVVTGLLLAGVWERGCLETHRTQRQQHLGEATRHGGGLCCFPGAPCTAHGQLRGRVSAPSQQLLIPSTGSGKASHVFSLLPTSASYKVHEPAEPFSILPSWLLRLPPEENVSIKKVKVTWQVKTEFPTMAPTDTSVVLYCGLHKAVFPASMTTKSKHQSTLKEFYALRYQISKQTLVILIKPSKHIHFITM